MTKRVGLYLRVSTDGQTVENQRIALEQAMAARGWDIVVTFSDAGISGAKGRDQRPGLDALHKAVVRREVDVVAAWALDRLGRSMRDLINFLDDIQGSGAALFLYQEGIDTTTPTGQLMFHVAGAFAQFERSMIVRRVNAGLTRARASGTKSGKAIGRPRKPAGVTLDILALRRQGMGMSKICKALKVGSSTVQRAIREAANA